jgi:hypothetical protein
VVIIGTEVARIPFYVCELFVVHDRHEEVGGVMELGANEVKLLREIGSGRVSCALID